MSAPDIERVARPSRPTLSGRKRSIARYIGFRLALAIPVILGVLTLIFAIGALTGNDPARAAIAYDATAAQRAAFAEEHGLNDPLPVRYLRYLNNLAHGDLGQSLVTQRPIAELVKDAIPVTVSLTLFASVLAMLLGFSLGIVAAVRRNSAIDKTVLVCSSVGHALPAFWVGLIFIQVFAVHWHLVPSGGYSPIAQGLPSWLHSMIAPALVLAIPFGAVMARVVRGAMVQELERDYVRTAEGLGLPPRTVIGRNVLRNALTAPVTFLGVGVGVLFSGAVLIESLFQLPGLGMMTVDGIREGDFGMVAAVGIFGSVAFVAINALVDVVCIALDPRTPTSS